MTQELITRSEDLAALCTRLGDPLKNEGFLTFDTEFMRERTYYPQLCLIQVAGEHEAAAIDALAPDLDLTPFWELLRNPKILKVFHAPRQDIEIFVHLSYTLPQPLFDTQIAAMALGFADQVSYAKLAETLAGVTIDKQEQFTDWTARPLRPAQIDYALQDVTVLRTVYTKLHDKLESLGRTAWLGEEMARLNTIETYRANPDDMWQRLKLRSNKPSSWAALRKLAAWRETEAMRLNRPRQMVLKDDVLSQLAMSVPTTQEQFLRTRGLPNSLQKEAVMQNILALMADAKKAGHEALPPKSDNMTLNAQQEDLLDLLRLALKITARQQNIAPRLLASPDDLTTFILGHDSPINHGWRHQLFGAAAQKLLKGEMAITLQGLVELTK